MQGFLLVTFLTVSMKPAERSSPSALGLSGVTRLSTVPTAQHTWIQIERKGIMHRRHHAKELPLAVFSRKTPKVLPGSTFLSHVQMLQSTGEVQATAPVGWILLETQGENSLRSRHVLMHPQHISQAHFH